MKRLTIKQAAQRLQASEQEVRMLITLGRIPGATYTGERQRKTYYIYDTQIDSFAQIRRQGNEER